MKIFLFRHGEIDNPKDLICGHLKGFHLSKEGKGKVVKVAKSLINKNIVRIYTSPLERTKETAEIIAKIIGLGTEKIEPKNEIIEVYSTVWQGKKKEDFLKNSQYIKNRLITTDMESRKDSGKRVFNFLKDIAKKKENAVLVSHGDPIMGAIGYISDRWDNLDELYIKKGEYYTVKINNGVWKIDF